MLRKMNIIAFKIPQKKFAINKVKESKINQENKSHKSPKKHSSKIKHVNHFS